MNDSDYGYVHFGMVFKHKEGSEKAGQKHGRQGWALCFHLKMTASGAERMLVFWDEQNRPEAAWVSPERFRQNKRERRKKCSGEGDKGRGGRNLKLFKADFCY